jgi:UDP-arabinose 4-epimerase
MRVLVTGGAGYIGSHTAKALAAAGHLPVSLDTLERGHRWAVRWGPLVVADLADRAALSRAFAEHRVEAVIHFAAYAYVGESMAHPDRYFRNNAVGTLNLLDAMREHGVGQIVFSSSCATYGDPAGAPIAEDLTQSPVNPYGESKLIAERMIGWYARLGGLAATALRYFNAAGADPEGELGEAHDPEPHLVPLAIAAALGRVARLEIYGTDYPTGDGTATRDYVHVSDLAEAHLLALQHPPPAGAMVAYNLGAGRGASVREVIAAVERAGGRPVPRVESPRRPGDPPVLLAAIGRAGRDLGWVPRRSGLDEIVTSAWAWHERRAAAGPGQGSSG